jgi:hypothetical protein
LQKFLPALGGYLVKPGQIQADTQSEAKPMHKQEVEIQAETQTKLISLTQVRLMHKPPLNANRSAKRHWL